MLSQLNYDKNLLDTEQIKKLEHIILSNPNAFSCDETELGCANNFEYEIRLKPRAKLHFTPSYKLSSLETSLLESEVKKFSCCIGVHGKIHVCVNGRMHDKNVRLRE